MDINRSVYVGNLSFDVTEDALKQTFSSAGTVTDAKLAKDPSTGRFRGFGFVEMKSTEEAVKSFTVLLNASINGREIVLEPPKYEMDLWEQVFGKEA
jgi:RNA recognition motif-containing protein